MTQKDFAIAKEVKAKVSQVVDLVDIRVFGSRARGDGDEYSDMDVFIEVGRLDKKQKEKIREIVWEIGFNNSIHISPLIYTISEITESPLRSSPVVKCILEEGITV